MKSQKPAILFSENSRIFNLSDYYKIVFLKEKLFFTEKFFKNLQKSYNFILKSLEKDSTIYGLNTGFGALGGYKLDNSSIEDLQKNLIYHLCTGTGEDFSEREKRGILFSRISSLKENKSGIHPETFKKLILYLNKNIMPYIPQIGTVGASGDLTPLAHLVLSYMGESIVFYNNIEYKNETFFSRMKIKSLDLKNRDGLSLVNGTSVMTALSLNYGILTERLFRISLIHSIFYAEYYKVPLEHFHPEFAIVKNHSGIHYVINFLYKELQKSLLIDKKEFHSDSKQNNEDPFQASYSIRAIPQALGAIYDIIHSHLKLSLTELNSVNDNPIFFPEKNLILHGANFYGQHIAFSSDNLKNAIIKLGIISERRIAKITDPKLNNGLPGFLTPINKGLNSGLMGLQVSSSAILSELRVLSSPASIQSIPTNGNNQDIVPLGTIAARYAGICLERVSEILAMEAICISQAIQLTPNNKYSEILSTYIKQIRKICSPLLNDRPLHNDIKKIKGFYLKGKDDFSKLIKNSIGI